jgi:lipopolysaccharide export LptBFGC system permease protein LptF
MSPQNILMLRNYSIWSSSISDGVPELNSEGQGREGLMSGLQHDASVEGVSPYRGLLNAETTGRLAWPAAALAIVLLSLALWSVIAGAVVSLLR